MVCLRRYHISIRSGVYFREAFSGIALSFELSLAACRIYLIMGPTTIHSHL